MQIEISVPEAIIANMITSAIESGDPVTTASKGGWCNGIDLKDGEEIAKQFEADDPWWSCADLYKNPRCVLKIAEVVDEVTRKEKVHTVCLSDLQRGLKVMAEKFPHLFAQVVGGDTDAACADIFLQCIIFGEEKYA